MVDIEKIILSYHKLLCSIDWSDDLLVEGLREGLNKFPSNAYIYACAKSKYYCGHYYSEGALELINKGVFSGLVFEHMVPKSNYIQQPCMQAARMGKLSLDFMRVLFEKYWKIAIITKEEDARLVSKKMPNNWDENNLFSRYEEAGIELEANPFVFISR